MNTPAHLAWLQGGSTACLEPPPNVGRAWRLVLLGPPGVGKGAQAHLLRQALGACPLSTGEVLRAARCYAGPATSTMAQAQGYMQRGQLVPDAVILAILRDRRRCLSCSGGFLLDGFPRTLPQAHALDEWLGAAHLRLDAVLDYELGETIIIARIAGRRVCPRCHAVFHVEASRPRVEGVCDECGSDLAQRTDDHREAVSVRLRAYRAATLPLVDYYRERGLLVTIAAEGTPPEVLARTLDALAARSARP